MSLSTAAIEARYGRFGPEAVEAVQLEWDHQGNLERMLMLLQLHVPHDPEAQHEVLVGFLEQFGAGFFLRTWRKLAPSRQSSEERQKLIEQALQNRIAGSTPLAGPLAEAPRPPEPGMVLVNGEWVAERRTRGDRRQGAGRRNRISFEQNEERRREDRRAFFRRASDRKKES